MRGLAERYATLLREPAMGRFLALTFAARVSLGTVSLALLLHVRELTGSFGIAGATTGSMLLASALAAPVGGRIVDRRGPRLLLLVTGIVSPLALLLLLFAGPLALSPLLLVACAALAGAFASQVNVLTRTSIRHRFDREDVRKIAFALDMVLVEICFTLGPLLVAALVAFANAWVAFAAAWFFAALAAPLFALSGALRYFHVEPDADRHLLGPLTEPRLLVVYLISFLITFTFGLMEVGYPAFGVALGFVALGAVLIAINSLGSAAGGLAYGGLHIAMAPERLLPRLLALMALPLGAHALASSAWVLAPLALIAGLLIAPTLTIVMQLVSTRAPARYATEAFTWSSTCIVSGLGAGMAVGGRLAEASGPQALFALAAAVIAVAASIAAWARASNAGIS